MYITWLQWRLNSFCGLLDVPYFYKNFDEKSAAFVEGLDEDYEKIRQAIRRKYPSLAFSGMFSYLQLQAFAHKVTHFTCIIVCTKLGPRHSLLCYMYMYTYMYMHAMLYYYM